MSLHFDLAIACDLKPDTPQQVINTLQYMTRTEDYDFHDPPAHEFFTRPGPDWRLILQIPHGTMPYGFPGVAGSSFRRVYHHTQFGVDVYRHTLSFRREMLDDSFYDWWPFAEWLALYSESSGCVGYYRATYDWQPTLIYFRDGRVYTCEVTQRPVEIRERKLW